jgi:hypothetical protein
MATSPQSPAGDTLPMSVANMTFLVNRLGKDCSPLQFVRELTQNGLEAIAAAGGKGTVVWDVDWNYMDLLSATLGKEVRKIACIDTGAGMTGPEMVEHINRLSSSMHEQSATGNFGVGAKIAAAPGNPHGVVYMSWKGGVGHMIHLWFDPEEKVYGLKRWPQNKGEFWARVSNDLRPKEIHEHGTVVTLLGKSDEDPTMEPPANTPMRAKWILRYLNTRYFRFPGGVIVKSREGWDLPRGDSYNFLRQVEGQGAWLDRNSESSGSLALTGATAHWWIIKDSVDRNSGHVAPGGHMAALFQSELYELMTSRAGISRLQMFGVIFGTDRVVIYVEPESTSDAPVTANTARTALLRGGEPLDWVGWSAEFRELMPEELQALQEEIGSKAGDRDHKKAILERLKQIKDLLRFARFKPEKDGAELIATDVLAEGGEPADLGGAAQGASRPGRKGGRAGDIYALFAEAGDTPASPVDSLGDPIVQWVSTDDGTRSQEDMKNSAAKFILQQNKLLVNADFRVFTDMQDRWSHLYAHVPGASATIRDAVHEWFQQQLVEAVMSAQALRNTGKWSLQELEQLWTEQALTTAVLPRWHVDQSIKHTLAMRLGPLRN